MTSEPPALQPAGHSFGGVLNLGHLALVDWSGQKVDAGFADLTSGVLVVNAESARVQVGRLGSGVEGKPANSELELVSQTCDAIPAEPAMPPWLVCRPENVPPEVLAEKHQARFPCRRRLHRLLRLEEAGEQ